MQCTDTYNNDSDNNDSDDNNSTDRLPQENEASIVKCTNTIEAKAENVVSGYIVRVIKREGDVVWYCYTHRNRDKMRYSSQCDMQGRPWQNKKFLLRNSVAMLHHL